MDKKYKTEIVIIGAGLSGMLASIALAEKNINNILLDRLDVDSIISEKSDGRTTAISYGSSLIFEEYGLWEEIKKEACPILDIRVTDNISPLFVHFNHRDVSRNPMGYIVQNHVIRKVLYNKIKQNKNITTLFSRSYKNIERSKYKNVIELNNNETINSSLIIAADGKKSNIRKLSNIKTDIWEYNQTALVCNVKHELNHHNVALEKFMPSGPFAVLPMVGGYNSSLVLTEKCEVAKIYAQLDEADFNLYLKKKFAGYLNNVKLSGKVYSYPLELYNAKKYYDNRVVLIGDAAHSIHPIAGQGFNLGIRDVNDLVKLLNEAKKVGQDLGNCNLLANYDRSRKSDCLSLIIATDALNRLFSNDISPIKHIRRIGLNLVNQSKTLKKGFIMRAMGLNIS